MTYLPEDVRVHVAERDGHKCARCGSRDRLEFDHVIPRWHANHFGIAASEVDAPWNLQLLCHRCNQMKGSTLPSVAEVDAVRAREAAWVRWMQAHIDEALATLRDPLLDVFHEVWEAEADLARVRWSADDHAWHVNRELPPGDWWRQDLQEFLEAGFTEYDLVRLIKFAHAHARDNAWGLFQCKAVEWLATLAEAEADHPGSP